MGNSFGYLHNEGGFQFAVVKPCKAGGIDLNKTCSLTFDSNHDLIFIGNVTRGHLEARSGIAGVGVSETIRTTISRLTCADMVCDDGVLRCNIHSLGLHNSGRLVPVDRSVRKSL